MPKIIVVEFKGASDRYTLHLLSSMANTGYEFILFSAEDCIQEPNASYTLNRVFPSYAGEDGKLKKFLKYLRAYIKVFLYARKKGCRVIHLQYFRNLSIDCAFWVLLFLSGFKMIYTAHNVLPHERKPFHKGIFKIIYQLFDAVIVTSSAGYKEIVKDLNLNPLKLKIIPIGYTGPLFFLKATKLEARDKIGIDPQKDVALFFGLIREYKGVDVLIEAAGRLAHRLKELVVVVAGHDCGQSYLKKIEKIETDLVAKGVIVKRIGYIPDHELPYYMLSADVVVLPYKRMSGHSSVLFLAYKYSRPVIATSVGGLQEAVDEGISGYLCKPGDPDGLAHCIEEAMSDKMRLAAMGERGNRLFLERYSWEAIGKSTSSLYRELFR
jgi:D-inositol-3-phosphate glycosyltransferase